MRRVVVSRSSSCTKQNAARHAFDCLSCENGQALIELALVVPIFAVILVGAAEFARLAYESIEVAGAARAAVQYGAQNHTTAVDIAGIRQAAVADSTDIEGLQVTVSNFCSCSDGVSITCSDAATNCSARIVDYVQVNTNVDEIPLFAVSGLLKNFELSGQATMRVEQ